MDLTELNDIVSQQMDALVAKIMQTELLIIVDHASHISVQLQLIVFLNHMIICMMICNASKLNIFLLFH